MSRPAVGGLCGVLAAGAVQVPGRAPIALPRPLDVSELARTAGLEDVRTLLVTGPGLRWLGLPPVLPKRDTAHRFFATPAIVERVLGWRMTYRRGGGGGPLVLVLLPYDVGGVSGPWAGERLEHVLAGLGLFAELVGMPWRDSVGRTAEALILSTHPREHGGRQLHRADVPEPCRDGALEQPYRWRRRIAGVDRGRWAGWYAHSFDQNAQYLSAWGSVELPVDDYVWLSRSVDFDRRLPGVWRTAGNPDPVRPFDPCRYLMPAPDVSGGDWRTTPTLALWSELVELAPPLEAYVWNGRTRYLRAAAERLRDARAVLLEQERAGSAGARLALAAVKAIYRKETGRFNMAVRDERSPWARPDWGHMIRAQARVNLRRRLAKLSKAPFAIDVDGLLFAATEPDAATFAASIGLPIGDKLGEFTIEHTSPLSAPVRKAASAAATFSAHKEAAA